MADPLLLGFGLTLGILFVIFMVFGPLPRADQVVKKQYGICEAWLTTRLCCLCIALPFYVFLIWMTLVITVEDDKGISVINQICPEDLDCSKSFAWGRENHDKEACQSADCGINNLLARSGSQPKKFARLGLGDDLSPLVANRTYECTVFEEGFCSVAEVKDVKEKCDCVTGFGNSKEGLCDKLVGCHNDVEKTSHTTKCLAEDSSSGHCTKWEVETDSAKQFAFQSCLCDTLSADGCSKWTCAETTMEYYYPNIFYAGAATILFITPIMTIFYYTAKTQMRKVFKCNDFTLYVYNQEAGMINEYKAEELRTGGFENEIQQKSKYRTCTKMDAALLTILPLLYTFFTYTILEVSGRVGLAFIGLAAGLLALFEIRKFAKWKEGRADRMDKRMEENNAQNQDF